MMNHYNLYCNDNLRYSPMRFIINFPSCEGRRAIEEMLIGSMRLRRLVTLRTAVGTLMTVTLPMPGGVH